MNEINQNDLLFYITIEEVQAEAKSRIGREVTEDELHSVKKGLEWGLTTDLDTIYDTIFQNIENP